MTDEQEARDARKVAYAKAIEAWLVRDGESCMDSIPGMVDDAFLAAIDEIEKDRIEELVKEAAINGSQADPDWWKT